MITDKQTIIEEAQAIAHQLSEWRRHLHQHPELSFQEYETGRFVSSRLKEFGNIAVQTNVAKTGVVGTLSSGSGPTIAIRADMDALPIVEQTGHDYRSKRDGVMHACGHDAHTAILLGIAKIFSDRFKEGKISGTVKFLFQPAEEDTDDEGLSGAPRMIQEGILDDVEAVIALHVCPWHPVGVIQVNDGYSMANVDVFHAKIIGSGGHGGYPHMTKDPIWMLGSVLQAFYGLVSRRISPLDTAAASIGKINTGTASNIIPEEVSITGTLRTYSPEAREQLIKEVENVFKITESFGGSYVFTVERGEPALKNDPAVNALLVETARNLYPDIQVEREPFGMGGEDFGYMTQKIPGAMFFLGCSLEDGKNRDLHTNIFDIDERCLEMGVFILAETATRLLAGNNDI
ncbi:M20 family metallopeptidase [Siminovitchia fortis]|uniref:Amidohydrolase n=1 Tax=Siminovitchia fortis TaxID=254758 RepID=A0A443IKP6_9BACI|nr:M20 family metallopeptidase [Siminovitchia fortis]RWR05417.1 amidohydrolase [Siminovitchia fortis]WHY80757.1 M20 family metallopeptidase [Siminovitchia fortis]